METIELIADRVKQNFSFMLSEGYSFEPLDIDNKDDINLITCRIKLTNPHLSRILVFDIYSNKNIRIDIFIVNTILDESLGIQNYLNFKKRNSPRYNPPIEVDNANLKVSVNRLSKQIQGLLEADLKDVINGRAWINIPTYDLRDDY